ncbi:MAG: outer membrane beta-barrel domain-containing protein [Deltaproteobacteria bacterium]|nr:outer membrane beta-barrel domain-containing protein [Deltaproteobacteria bacterium]
MKATKILLLVVLASLGLAIAPRGAAAQEIQLEGPLAGAPAVRHLVLLREGRFFVTPQISFTILDTFRRHMMFGLKAEYNIFDWLSAGVYGGGGFGWRTGIADQINDRGVDDVPNQDYDLNFPLRGELDKQLGQMQWMVAAEARVIPLRGKMSFFGKLFVAVDVYLNLGVGIVGVKERGNTDCSIQPGTGTRDFCPAEDTYNAMQTRVAVGPTFGGGVTVYFNDWIGLNLEYRSTPFTWNQSGTDEFGASEVELDQKINADDQFLYWNQMMTIGCTFAFPLTPERTP